MKNYLVIAFLVVMCFACKFGSTENLPASNKVLTPNNAHPSTTPSVANNSTPAKTESNLSSLKSMKDKTATEIKLWQNKDVNGRLEKLMGADYATMKKFWNVETPMVVDSNVLELTGCEQHNCGDNQYMMFIDTANDNINVFHISEKKLKSYLEKGEIKLPKSLAEDFATTKSISEIK